MGFVTNRVARAAHSEVDLTPYAAAAAQIAAARAKTTDPDWVPTKPIFPTGRRKPRLRLRIPD